MAERTHFLKRLFPSRHRRGRRGGGVLQRLAFSTPARILSGANRADEKGAYDEADRGYEAQKSLQAIG